MTNLWEKIAKDHGTTEQEVREEIESAIVFALLSQKAIAQPHWEALCENDMAPTPEALVQYICDMIPH